METGNREQLFQLQAEICKTMADAKRLKIIHELRDGELSVTDICTRLGLSQSNTSQHLSILKRRGLLSSRREGTTVYYSLSSGRIAEACDLIHSVLNEQLKLNRNLSILLSQGK